MINVLLAEKQPLMRAGLIKFLEADGGIQIEAVPMIYEGLTDLLGKSKIDVLITDPNTLGFITLQEIAEIRHSYPTTKVLILTADHTKSKIVEILQLGVSGFLMKDCDQPELIQAVYQLSKGEKYYCQDVLNLILETSFHPILPEVRKPSILTVREEELLKLIAGGYSNLMAAQAMNLSPHTIHTHRKKITKKLNIKSPTEFLVRALDLGLVKLTNKGELKYPQ